MTFNFEVSDLFCFYSIALMNLKFTNTDISLHFPPSHTLGTFLSAESKEVATAAGISIKFDYEYNDRIDPGNVDLYTLNIHVEKPKIFAHGFFMKYLSLLKLNYAGGQSNFTTLDEYRNRMQNPDDEFLSDWEQWVLKVMK